MPFTSLIRVSSEYSNNKGKEREMVPVKKDKNREEKKRRSEEEEDNFLSKKLGLNLILIIFNKCTGLAL